MKRIFSFLLPFMGCYFISCVYFNTFYNAETSYKKALIIIEESPILEDDKFPEQAKKLLGEAIENSKIVLRKYPESKYVDDAVFIIAKASFLRGETAIAESYFNQLIRDYPESKFHELSEIWLAYTHLRMDMISLAQEEIKKIKLRNNIGDEKSYLIHNIMAEIDMLQNHVDGAYSNYEKAAKFAPSKSKKVSMYGKLIILAEKNQDKAKASNYLLDLANVAPDAIRIDARMKWVTYQRELGNYEGIISEIQRMLVLSEFSSEYMRLELELGKVYKGRGDTDLAKEMFGLMVEKYTNSKKDEIAEAYYQLGFMALMEDFNIDLAREYFENSKKAKISSFYGRASKELINKINQYETLVELYDEINSNTKDPGDDQENKLGSNIEDSQGIDDGDSIYKENQNRVRDKGYDLEMGDRLGKMDFSSQMPNPNLNPADLRPDSILFIIGEMLLYDFNHQELSFSKFKSLTNEYPGSPFAEKSLYVLSYFDPIGNWSNNLEEMYPNSIFLNPELVQTDTSIIARMERKRDHAWSLGKNSYQESYVEFNRLYEEYNDTLSAYIRAYISDYYLNDMRQAIQHYNEFIDNFSNHGYYAKVENRLKIIETDLELQKSISQQGVDYSVAVKFFQSSKDFDSTKILLNGITSGKKSQYKDAANHLKSVMRVYKDISEKIIKNNSLLTEDKIDSTLNMTTIDTSSNNDSLIFLLANLFYNELEFIDSAKFYYENLVTKHGMSSYRPHALLALSEMEEDGKWASILSTDYPDTIFISDSISTESAYDSHVFKEDFVVSQDDLINICDDYLNYFSDSLDINELFEDTTIVISDTNSVQNEKINNDDSIPSMMHDTVFNNNENEDDIEVDFIKKTDLIDDSIPEQFDLNQNQLIDNMESEYMVHKGETLFSIAKTLLGSPKQWPLIYEWNKEVMGSDSTLIFPYQILVIKSKIEKKELPNINKFTYSVKQGETLWKIASKLYEDPYAWKLLLHDNKETCPYPDKIMIDQELFIRDGI